MDKKGEAYATYDSATKTLTFKRADVIPEAKENEIIYTKIEESNLRFPK